MPFLQDDLPQLPRLDEVLLAYAPVALSASSFILFIQQIFIEPGIVMCMRNGSEGNKNPCPHHTWSCFLLVFCQMQFHEARKHICLIYLPFMSQHIALSLEHCRYLGNICQMKEWYRNLRFAGAGPICNLEVFKYLGGQFQRSQWHKMIYQTCKATNFARNYD